MQRCHSKFTVAAGYKGGKDGGRVAWFLTGGCCVLHASVWCSSEVKMPPFKGQQLILVQLHNTQRHLFPL